MRKFQKKLTENTEKKETEDKTENKTKVKKGEAKNTNKQINIEKEKLKTKVPRLKLNENLLFYNNIGVRKLYELTENLDFNDKMTEVNKLNKVMEIYKNWHFMVFPKYDFEYFISKLGDYGNKPSGKAFMSRIRKVHKKEDTFEAIFKDEFINSLNKSGKKGANPFHTSANKPELSKENIERLNEMEKKIEKNLKGLDINKIQEKVIEQRAENIYDEKFIIQEDNKDQELDTFYQNMQDNIFERDDETNVVQKLNFIDEIKETQNYENKKRSNDEAFSSSSNNCNNNQLGGERKLKNH